MSDLQQAQLGRDCAWCDKPAVGEIEVQPARYRQVTWRNPQTGETLRRDEIAQRAINAWVCADHLHIAEDQPPHVKSPRTTRDKTAEQTTIFDTPGSDSRRNAIYGGGA